MTSSRSSLFRGWRAALLLVVVACATPDRATAECGDHVTILNTFANRDGDASSKWGDTTETPASPKPPCSGPNCSGAPDRHHPPAAPVPTSGPHGKEVAQVLGSVELSDHASSRVCDFISPRPISRVSAVFHPPRVG